jgi:LuxR family transcriptional regulator, maltose regulon positive regulatory protein
MTLADRAQGRRRSSPKREPAEEGPAHDIRIFASKLTMPVHRPGSVRRAGLVNRLRVARAAALVLVTAPAGYGKTTLAADWARRDDRPFAWYSVDEADDAVTFVAHLAAAVSGLCSSGTSRPDVAAGYDRPDVAVALLARGLASVDSAHVLVLDDVDSLQEAESIRLLGRFVEELPPASQLVLISRSEPPLPLARLRARAQLVEFGVDDLRFSDREAGALLHGTGVELGRADVEALNDVVEGWPAGLYLAALSLRSSDARGERAPRGDGMIFDYLQSELVSHLPDDQARFLTRISVLDRFCGPLCDVVAETDRSADLLEQLERSNLFIVPLDRERRWYRIHSVYRAVLAAELERREPGVAKTLRSRAAAWYAEHGDPELALDYARGAGDVEQLLELVERSALPFTATARPARVEGWLGALDDETLLERHPAAAAIGALTWAMTGRPDAAERWANAAERASAAASRSRRKEKPAASTHWPALLHSLMCPSGPEEMLENAEHALVTLPLDSPWRAPALFLLGSAHALLGDTSSAESVLREAADTAASVGAAAVESVVLGYQSLLATERGDWSRADALAETARQTLHNAQLDDDVTSLFALAASARSSLRRGDWNAVRADLERAAGLLPRLTYAIGSFSVFLRIEFARIQLALGDPEGALHLLDEVDDVFARRPHLGVFRKDANELRARVEADAQSPSGRMSALTAAELRLLPLLTTHLSFREIAERLYVSRNTVKTQAISVYRKLGVSSRGEAISRASDLGLVADGSQTDRG